MFQPEPNQLQLLVSQAITGKSADQPDLEGGPGPDRGSRRRRIWELEQYAQCPVLGVCLPLEVLRRVMSKARGAAVPTDDYGLHCAAVADCKRRCPASEAVQRELDRRYASDLRITARIRCVDALAACWADACARNDIAGVLWAVLTHPCCTSALAHRIDGQVHMLQHQVGAAARADLDRLVALQDENGVLVRALAAAQQRTTRMTDEHARRLEQLKRQVAQLRALALAKDAELAEAQAELRTLQTAMPGLASRLELARENEHLLERQQTLRRRAQLARHEAERLRRRAERSGAATPPPGDVVAAGAPREVPAAPAQLGPRAVLCVGGRPASVPIYRQIIEDAGGRFLHHDGGEEEHAGRLDATLAAADLVICQAGCISHNAYWRVKDHCKRTGKRCVFVEKPSRSAMQRVVSAVGTELAGETVSRD